MEFPGTFTFEIDSPDYDGMPLNYDINFSEEKEIQQGESIDILDPNVIRPIEVLCKQDEGNDILDSNVIRPVRSLLKANKRVHFCPVSTWYNMKGEIQNKPLSNKYTLRYSISKFSFSPCI